jgi:hypothetical protein
VASDRTNSPFQPIVKRRRDSGRFRFSGGDYGTISRVADLLCCEGGPSAKTVLIGTLAPLLAVGAYTVAIAVTEIRNWHRNERRLS